MEEHELVERVLAIVREVIRVPALEVNINSSPTSIAGWDSVAHLDLLLALEQEFGLRLTQEQMEQMSDVPSILATLRSLL